MAATDSPAADSLDLLIAAADEWQEMAAASQCASTQQSARGGTAMGYQTQCPPGYAAETRSGDATITSRSITASAIAVSSGVCDTKNSRE